MNRSSDEEGGEGGNDKTASSFLVNDILLRIFTYLSYIYTSSTIAPERHILSSISTVSKQWRVVSFSLPYLEIRSSLIASFHSTFDISLYKNLTSLKLSIQVDDITKGDDLKTNTYIQEIYSLRFNSMLTLGPSSSITTLYLNDFTGLICIYHLLYHFKSLISLTIDNASFINIKDLALLVNVKHIAFNVQNILGGFENIHLLNHVEVIEDKFQRIEKLRDIRFKGRTGGFICYLKRGECVYRIEGKLDGKGKFNDSFVKSTFLSKADSPSKFEYEGGIDDDFNCHGKGISRDTSSDGNTNRIYNGDFFHGCAHGYGRDELYYHHPSRPRYNVIYEGNFDKGLRHGLGILHYNDGSSYSYKGEWKQDLRNGKGALHMIKKNIHVYGVWCNDRCVGKAGVYKDEKNLLYKGYIDYDIFNGEHAQKTNCHVTCKENVFMSGTFFPLDEMCVITGDWDDKEDDEHGFKGTIFEKKTIT